MADPHDNGFGHLLAALRTARGWSQAKLGAQAGLDTSTISRYEAGLRAPDRDTVLAIASAMALPIVERDRLLAIAGFRPGSWDEPMLSELAELLADPTLARQVSDDIKTLVRVALDLGRRARGR